MAIGFVIAIVLLMVITIAAANIYIERRLLSLWQDRRGPNRAGPWGLLQVPADMIKIFLKEDWIPPFADRTVFVIAPTIVMIVTLLSFAVIPFAPHFFVVDSNIALLFFLANSSLGVYSVVLAGWASNNKYSLLGAMRAAAQMISYEIPIAVAILAIATLAGSLDMQEIIYQQGGGFWNWNIFGGPGAITKIWVIPFTVTLFLIYFIGSLAETNRVPFDIPEGESEIVAGYHTEYSGMKFAMFFFAEYSNMFIVSAIITILFLGGWQSPFGDFLNGPVWQAFWFVSKAMLFVFLQIWLRWTLPRLRVDQLMYVTWKVMLPIAFVAFFAVALWAMIK